MVRLDSASASGPAYFGRYLQARTSTSGTFTLANVTADTYTLIAIPPIVTSGSDVRGGVTGSTVTFSSAGIGRSGVMTESRNGVVTHYRDDLATKAQISVSQGDLSGLQVIVRLPR